MTRMTSSRRQTRLPVCVATLSLVMLMNPSMIQAQTTDITPSGLNTTVGAPTPLPNGMIKHDITGGTRPGNGLNLFHSFGEFSVGTKNIANFLNETALPTSNILSRVTGGNPSKIFGTLQTTNFGAANLYLINPAGVIFGPTAELNVSGSFAASTADYLKMTDGAKFYANPAQPLGLLIAPVEAFGFLGTNPGGTISVQGGVFLGTPSITLVGRDLTVGNTTTPGIVVDNGGSPGTSVMIGNLINLISVGQPADPVLGGEINNSVNFPFSGFGSSPGGNMRISSGQIATTSGFMAVTPPTGTVTFSRLANINNTIGNGGINIQTGTFLLQGSLFTASFGQTIPGPTTVTATKAITLDGGSIQTSADAALPGPGKTSGSITFTSPSVTLTQGAQLLADVIGPGFGGNITLNTQQLTMTSDSTITSNAHTAGTGKAGSITITGAGSAPTTISGGAIQAQSETSESAGNITFHASGDLTLFGTKVSVKNTGLGDAGSINLLAGNDLLVRNSQVSTESAQASGGNIKLTAPNLIRIVGSTITSSVQGQAGSNGGNINIDPQLVVIQNSRLLATANAGAGGNINIAASGAVLVDPNSLLNASAGPAGVSGSVNINAPIQILSGALVPLKLAYSQAGLSGDRCAADPKGQFSSFIQTGRDGVPQVPGALSPSPLSFLDTLTSGSLGSQLPNVAAARLGLDSVSFDDSTLFRFHSACRS